MRKRVLILGCTGMMGHKLFERLSGRDDLDVYAAARSPVGLSKYFASELVAKIRQDVVDVDIFDTVVRALASIQPDVVVNCIGLIKQLPMAGDPLTAIKVNSLLPHRLSLVCRTAGARMIHISTDCIFNGSRGNYAESDPSDATDLYGRSKFLGEVEYPHCVTLRTSIIGHELKGGLGLIDWFLAQDAAVRGYAKAIYTGFTTVEMARIISDHVIPNPELKGVYHVSSEKISKYELLKMVAERYGKRIDIARDEIFILDRSLDSTKFRKTTGYVPPSWPEMIEKMYRDYKESANYRDTHHTE